MVNIIGQEAMLHISFSLAAFIFSVVLYILVCALGTGQVHKNLTFRTLIITIVLGNLISILDNIFRDSGVFPTPPQIKLALLLLVFLANILLTYYMALYMEGFFHEFWLKKVFFTVNLCLVLSSIVITVAVYLRQIILYDGEAIVDTIPFQFGILLGYFYELYYLVYVITLFIIFGKTLSERARWTSVSAIAVAIGGVLFEMLNTFGITSGILYNYFSAVLALYIFYIGVETPDYRNLLQSMQDLDAAKKAADRANQSKSNFLANMSHEIRTPINTVLGMNEMILREARDETVLSYSENIQNAGTTLLGLISDILDFSKIDAGKIEIIPAEYDLFEVIKVLVDMIFIRADEKGLLLNLDFDKDMPRYLYGDEVRVKQIITNILTNAVKYTEKGSVSFSIGYEKTADDPGYITLKVAVKDTGIGIKPEDIPRLFSEFERIEEKRNRNVEGTGLGMSITQSLLKLMGSSLKVESTYGLGSVFSFELKQKVVRWEKLGDFDNYYREGSSGRKKYRARFTAPDARVLIVDDNKMNLMVVKSLLKQTLMKVDTAGGGDEGLELAGENKYDIILLDHMMPKKDGIETLHELKEAAEGPNVDTPVICLTANALSGARDYYRAEGFEDYLPKPIDTAELENMLMEYLPGNMLKEASGDDAGDDEEGPVPEKYAGLKNYEVDVERGIKNSESVEAYADLLKVFYESMDENAGELDRFYSEGDLKEYTIRIHSLKSSARIIGAYCLGEEAQRLEDAGKREDGVYIRDHHDDFMEDYGRLRQPLSFIFSMNEENKDRRPADAELMASVYREIKAAAEEMDTGRLDEIFDRMEEYAVPEEEAERWKKIRTAYDQFDYSDIVALLE